ncbi:replication restart DNA helicase PriA [Dongia mobilis]|uniref:Replication restart protein PriA n=1 Tax=Dongia mobilis TaxID=578943 RepID=A0A4R6WYE6_9PROT|nr:primosomal protein N' [Dongia mobilis]TDQ86321.1 replication restart DNA helicase PriA [Dongia mobilis]
MPTETKRADSAAAAGDPASQDNAARDSGARNSTAAAAEQILGVLLPLALFQPYDYLVPGDFALRRGDFVTVPLGRRLVTGVVWGEGAGDVPREKLKAVAQRLPVAPLPAITCDFIDWVAQYCMAPLGAVLRMAMSVPEALQPERQQKAWAPGDADPASRKLTPQRAKVLQFVADQPPLPATELARATGVTTAVIAAMGKLGLLKQVPLPLPRPYGRPDADAAGPNLSSAQADAAAALARLQPGVTLIDGVTGSGKTEVYFEAIAATLRAGRQVLVLVPEIALTPQWLTRFEARFGAPPAQWHSELTGLARRLTWRGVHDGSARVVVGARSALFLPYRDLGLIIVDEEHESAFKQEDGVIYQARDMAVVRGHLAKIPVILASATPSLETMVNVEGGRYGAVHLPARHGGAQLPEIGLIDLRVDKPPRQSWIAPSLRAELAATLATGDQALLFLNRRGYAPLTLCRTCGHRLQCPRCTAWLVEHRFHQKLMCHHCGFEQMMPPSCPACLSEGSFAACGPGVERLAEEAAALFPEARRLVLTSDTVTGPARADQLMKMVAAREVDLVIGTQIIAKGHNFPHLTLVGVVDADLGLHGGDLRAAERTFQLMSQVAGRAGRGMKPGHVLLQTHDPDRHVMQALKSGDRDAFMAAEAEDRRAAGMPPFGRLAALILSGRDEAAVQQKARELARAAPHRAGITVLGPAPAPLALLRGRHRLRFLLKTRREIAPQGVLRHWLRGQKFPGDLRLQIDIDPYSFM